MIKQLFKVGITTGDINGVGLQLIIRYTDDVLKSNKEIVPIVFSSKSVWNFYLSFLKINNLQYNLISKISDAKEGVINIFDCTQSDLVVQPGIITKDAGIAAGESLTDYSTGGATQCAGIGSDYHQCVFRMTFANGEYQITASGVDRAGNALTSNWENTNKNIMNF